MNSSIEVLSAAVAQAAASRGGFTALAEDLEVPYDALYQLGTGRRVRSVNVDLLVTLARKVPGVAEMFAQSA